MYVNGKEVSTKAYVDSKTKNAWAFKKNGTNAYYSNWNVWIWTTSPTSLLQLGDGNKDNGVTLYETRPSNSPNLGIYESYDGKNNINEQSWLFWYWVRPMNDAWMVWEKWFKSYWRNLFTIKANWNVWIWTTNPKAKLDVNGNVKLHWDLDITNTTNNKWYPAIRNNGKWILGIDESKKEISIGSTYKPDMQNVVIHSINWRNTLVASGWNVWIWTTNPKAKLEIWDRKSSWAYWDDNTNNNHIIINWAYTYYNGNVNQSTYLYNYSLIWWWNNRYVYKNKCLE